MVFGWYEPSMMKHKRELDTLPYKLLRLAVKDWYRILPNLRTRILINLV